MDVFDILTEINLSLISDKGGAMYLTSFVDENGNRLIDNPKGIKAMDLASYMESEGLVNVDGEMCSLTKKGRDVLAKGGWNEYNNHLSSFSNRPQTINTNPKETTTKKNKFGKKFWELISENKLISGIILIIIGYLIKLIFGIEF